jgi:[glutamine synthetase] adenylyltransferase / [glutamine synthetase]-adenylyl-L-tyrosine phosphorylase
MMRLPSDQLPAELAEVSARNWDRLVERATEHGEIADRLDEVARGPRDQMAELAKLLACSQFAADVAARDCTWFVDFVASQAFLRSLDVSGITGLLDQAVVAARDPETLGSGLRTLRHRLLVHIIWRDINGHADCNETTAAMSLAADGIIDCALAMLHRWAVEADTAPVGDSGAPQQMVVIALGKLGAGELNLSSDVDLVFAYPETGTTVDGRKTNQQFFTALGQRLIQVLDSTTVKGLVFRVDMRLRPFGESGPLVCSFDAMERYFEEHGRDWERYAWIRARACAGDLDAGDQLIRTLRPFVFRRYLDFGAIAALRDMKSRIEAERRSARMAGDIKLGPGGIRDVEFIAQMLQLIWAGRHGRLRQRRIDATYLALTELGLMAPETASALYAAYSFLRDLEHKLQAVADQQTQKLPVDPLERLRVSEMMGFSDPAALDDALAAHRQVVAGEFAGLIGVEGSAPTDNWRELWHETDGDALRQRLTAAGFDPADAVADDLVRLRTARDRPWVGNEGQARLDELMPIFLAAAQAAPRPCLAVTRVVPLFEAVIRRSAYFVLLLENPQALRELVQICATSRWLSDELARHPALLDELLDPNLLYTVADRETLRAALAERLRWAGDDFEAQLEVLRKFKESHTFRVAACELKGILPLMNVSDYLTYLAEVILEQALAVAWNTTENTPEESVGRPFIIVGYGKLGGLELGPGSDLDLVFVHRLGNEHLRFLHRMVRRLLQVLTTHTHSGSLYDVDMRLRPSGHSGMLISALAAFEKYQREQAWTWEHQALVRARVVAGDPVLARDFERVREQVLCQPRESADLKRRVLDMRRRIEDAASGDADLKRPAGGIVDIEFMVQYLVLGWAHDHPELCRFTDNIRVLETAASLRLIDAEQALTLKDAYLALRAERHRTALDIADDARAREVLARYRERVRDVWNALFGE